MRDCIILWTWSGVKEATSAASAAGLIGDPEAGGGAIGDMPGIEGGEIDGGGGGLPKLGLVDVNWS